MGGVINLHKLIFDNFGSARAGQKQFHDCSLTVTEEVLEAKMISGVASCSC